MKYELTPDYTTEHPQNKTEVSQSLQKFHYEIVPKLMLENLFISSLLWFH